MDWLDALQWPAMVVTVSAAWLIGSQRKIRRMIGFWCFLLSNALWIIWSITIAQARACQPQMIQSTLLTKKHQKPIMRRIFRCEPMSQAALTVTTIAGH
ncbi:MAG TPA: hypothetical protein VF089_20600 [Candidatus Binatia bacterium]